jgi:hypothetical protein
MLGKNVPYTPPLQRDSRSLSLLTNMKNQEITSQFNFVVQQS